MMNNSDLADHLAGATGATKADARKAVDLVFAAIADAAAKGEADQGRRGQRAAAAGYILQAAADQHVGAEAVHVRGPDAQLTAGAAAAC